MDPDVARLVREQRLVDAARLASDRGDPRSASEIYEHACEWSSAAAEAMRAGDGPRAIELALYAGDETTAQQALALVGDPAAKQSVAARLAHHGRYTWAARLLESCGRNVDAARLWERGGDALRAAALLEGAGEAVEASRVLQAAMLRDPRAWGVGVALGAMLDRLGKWEAAVRLLQRVPPDAPERREALVPLIHSLQRLGLDGAASEATTELARLQGGPAAPAQDDAPATAARPAQAASVFGRYQVLRQVASSPSARLLECLDVVRGERVAVKLFAGGEDRGGGRDALARFEREVEAMKALQHPSVVPLRDFLPEGPALVLAWMDGGTLERMMTEMGPIAPERAVDIASAVLAALGAAHRLGIVHRDVKPANVLFDDGGGARLGDFGVAHLGDLSTTATAGLGTMAYMSPEQRGGRPVTAASDVFAVGVMVREMLTGERPRPDDRPSRLPSEAHRGLDARHDAAVSRLTARDPLARPVDAFEARALLASLPWPRSVDAETVKRHPISTRSPPPPADRLALRPDGTVVDSWTERRIERVSLTEHTLARARAFAVADHPALQPVWRVDEEAGAIWLGALDDRLLDRPLTLVERTRIGEALDALHAAGGAHGRVDRQHLVDAPAGVVLRFGAAHDADATADRDKAALAKL